MRRLFVLLLFLSFNWMLHAQQQVGIKHYQRKTDSFSFVFPSDVFLNQGLMISLPDSLYNFGSVTIKSAKFDSFSAKNYALQFESDTVTLVQFTIKGKRQFEKYQDFILHSIKPSTQNDLESNWMDKPDVQLTYHDNTILAHRIIRKGRKRTIIITTSN